MTFGLMVLLLAAAYAAAAVWTYHHTRGVRVVRCPVTHQTVRIELAAARAAALLAPRSAVTVRTCSLWPERRSCAQWCCDDIEMSRHGCRMDAILAEWYAGKRCAYCQREVRPPAMGELRPALRAPDGELIEWSDIDPTRLYDVLATHQPVCASCDVAETFRSRHGDWVVERPRPEDPAPRAGA